MLRDLVHAEITFKELARQTGLGEKTLHRMLSRNGNPTARNLGAIVKSIAEDLGIKPRVEVAMSVEDYENEQDCPLFIRGNSPRRIYEAAWPVAKRGWRGR